MQYAETYEVVEFRTFIAEPDYGWFEVKSSCLSAAKDDIKDLHKRGLVEAMPSVDDGRTHRSRITVPYFQYGDGKIAETVIVHSSTFTDD